MSGDISNEGLGAGDFFNGIEINTDDGGVERHELLGDLHPATGGGTEIDESGGVVEEIVLSVELDEFVGGPGSIALSLGVMIIGIESLFGLGFLTHFLMLICLLL